jgi:hypothetical protein
MSKYMFQISYTEAGFQGILKEGGSDRREAVETAIKVYERSRIKLRPCTRLAKQKEPVRGRFIGTRACLLALQKRQVPMLISRADS